MPWGLETTHSSMKVCVLMFLDGKSAFSSGAPLSLLLRVPGPGCTLESIGELEKYPCQGSTFREPDLHKWVRPGHQHFKVYQWCFCAARGENTGLVLSLSQPRGPRLFFPQRSLCLLLFKGGSLELCSKGVPGLLFFSWRTLYWSLLRAQRSSEVHRKIQIPKRFSFYQQSSYCLHRTLYCVSFFSLFFRFLIRSSWQSLKCLRGRTWLW